jgi:CBS domain-containing protein
MRRRLVKDVIAGQRLLALPPEATVREAARRMREANVGAVLVVADDGRLAGIFTERDGLFRVVAEGKDPDATPLSQVMSRTLITVAAATPVTEALHLMHDGGFRHVPVVEKGIPVGVVSIRDALGDELTRFHDEVERKRQLLEIVR